MARIEQYFGRKDEAEKDESFPKSFDFVYWNVWDNYDFDKQEQLELLKKLGSKVNDGGRLILGFYRNKEETRQLIEKLKKAGILFSGELENPTGGNEVLAWIDIKRKI